MNAINVTGYFVALRTFSNFLSFSFQRQLNDIKFPTTNNRYIHWVASLLPNNRSKAIVKRVFQTNPIKGENYLSLASVMRTDSNKITINATPGTCLVKISFFFSFFFFVVNDPFEDSSRRLFSFQRPNDAPRYVFTLTSGNIS